MEWSDSGTRSYRPQASSPKKGSTRHDLAARSSQLLLPRLPSAIHMITRSTTLALLRRPAIWPTAVGAVFAFARPGWWRRIPFLPIPDDELMRWRTTTAYGSDDVELVTEDVVAYLEWRQRFTQGQTRGG